MTGGILATSFLCFISFRYRLVNIAIFSDIHGNLSAFESALRAAEKRRVDAAVCLGDIVGYGPEPEACIDLVRTFCDVVVMGNHDAAVAHEAGLDALPPDGRSAARLHRKWISTDDLAWLADLPLRAERFGATFVHASPAAPARWERLDSLAAVRAQFETFSTALCFVGHSHRPAVAADSLGVLTVRPGHRFLVDVGSVGQPRDHDTRLAFALYDPDAFSVETVRAHYDVEQTISRMHDRDLPMRLGKRLRRGA